MEGLIRDVRVGLRLLMKSPGFTFAAVLTLSLGIGAGTAIYSVVNAILVQPLPYPEPDRLVWIWESSPSRNNLEEPASVPNFHDWREQNEVFRNMAAFGAGYSPILTGSGEPERLQGGYVTPNFFSVVGVQATAGRTFLESEGVEGGPQVVLLSHGLWQRRFGADPDIIGRPLTLNGKSRTVVGVMPSTYRHLDLGRSPAQLWIPMQFDPDTTNRRSDFLRVVARLGPGVSIEQARADMDTIAARLEREYPETNSGWGVTLLPLHERVSGEVRPVLLTLLAAVMFLLLIVCANLANLQLSRATARRRETAIRLALGAARGRLFRQILTESLILSLMGGAAGVLLASWGVEALRRFSPADLPRMVDLGLDLPVLGFSLLLSLLTGLAFGVLPAWQISRLDPQESLKEASRESSGGGAAGRRARSGLIIVEVGLALVLLIGSGLMIESLRRLMDVDAGFRPDSVLTARLGLSDIGYGDPAPIVSFYDSLLQQISALPGVDSAAAAGNLPHRADAYLDIMVRGRPIDPAMPEIDAAWSIVTPGYFETMGIPLVRGRLFGPEDDAAAPGVLLIDEELARRAWPDGDPLGATISVDDPVEGPWYTVIGIVRSVRNQGLDAPPYSQAYRPHAQTDIRYMNLMIRTSTDPLGLAPALRSTVRRMDPDQPVAGVATYESILAESMARRRFTMFLLSLFAIVAVILAAVGIYGVLSYAVSQRTREIGIRMALGARRSDVVSLVTREGALLVAAGLALGIIAAIGLTGGLSSLLFDVRATDPVTFTWTALALAGLSALACYVPARRATMVDPMEALREE